MVNIPNRIVDIQKNGALIGPREMEQAYFQMARYIHWTVQEHGGENVAMLAIKDDGSKMIPPLISAYRQRCYVPLAMGYVDNSLRRDDGAVISKGGTEMSTPNYDINGKHIVLVDAVFETGRSAFAAMNSLFDYGSPASIKLAVLYRRSETPTRRSPQKMPISPDFVYLDETDPKYKGVHIPYDIEAKLEVNNGRQSLVLRELSASTVQGAVNGGRVKKTIESIV